MPLRNITKKKKKTPSVEPRRLRPAALTGAQRRHLRALAHSLKPIVQVGKQGLTSEIFSQIDRALDTHELIKVKVSKESPVDMKAAVGAIETEAFGHVAQTIGKTFVVYRQRKKDPTIALPGSTKRTAAKKPAASAAPKRGKPARGSNGRPRRQPARAASGDADDWGSADPIADGKISEVVEIG